ncbi:hypothetical protein AB0I84_26920, partial [Streptomyces spectabilis]
MTLKHKAWLAVGSVVLGSAAVSGTGAVAHAATGTADSAADLVAGMPRAGGTGALSVLPGAPGGPDAA